MVFAIPLSSLYCNTLLANLNARAYIRGEVVVSPVSDDTKADQQSGEVQFISPAHHVSFSRSDLVEPVMNPPDDDCARRAFGGPQRW